MFTWFSKWSRPQKAAAHKRVAKSEAVQRAPSAPPAPALVAVPAPAAAADLPFLDQLEQALVLPAPLGADEERQVSALIVQVVDYVCRTKIDPPVMPALAPRVLSLVNEPVVDIVQLSRLIEHDLAISAKLLSVANSAAFGGRTEVKTVREAITFLGTEQVAQVAIGLACSSLYEREDGPEAGPARARWSRLFTHAMASAYGAANLALRFGRSQSEQAFLGGLFHDVGKAVALRAIETLTTRGKLPELSQAVLDEALQRIHAYPGEEFYAKWTLPEALMTICAQHHQLEELGDAPPALYCVSLMSGFDTLWFGGAAEQREAMPGLRLCAEKLGLSDAQLRAAHTQARTLGERTQRMFEKRG